MQLFLMIPEALQAELLSHWLSIESVAVLDSALCTSLLRPLFLDLLAKRCLFPCVVATEIGPTNWLRKRKVRATCLKFGHNVRWYHYRWKWFQIYKTVLEELEVLGVDEDPPSDDDDDDGYFPEDFSLLYEISKNFPHLTKLVLRRETLNKDFSLIFDKCIHINTLQLENCFSITQGNVASICKGAKNLKRLVLSGSSIMERESVHWCYKSDSLRQLCVRNASVFTNDLIDLCSRFAYLTHLTIGPIDGEDLCAIASHCAYIRVAAIDLEIQLSDEHAKVVCKAWSQLQLFQLKMSNSLGTACSEDTMLILLRQCPNLLKLCVGKLPVAYPHGKDCLYYTKDDTENTIRSDAPIFNSCVKTIAQSNKVTDIFLERISESTLSTILVLCPQLNTVALRHKIPYSPSRDESNPQTRAAEYALSLLCQPACRVRKLHLYNIYTLSAVDVLSISCLEELQLSLIGVSFDNQTLLKLVRNNPYLQCIALYECQGLSGSVLVPQLLKACRKLHTFIYHEYGNTNDRNRRDVTNPAVVVLEEVVKYLCPHIKVFRLLFKQTR